MTDERRAPPRKIDAIRAAMRAGEWEKAIGLAAKLPRLGRHKGAILGAREAVMRPEFQRQIGKNVAQLIAAGIDALRARFGHE